MSEQKVDAFFTKAARLSNSTPSDVEYFAGFTVARLLHTYGSRLTEAHISAYLQNMYVIAPERAQALAAAALKK